MEFVTDQEGYKVGIVDHQYNVQRAAFIEEGTGAQIESIDDYGTPIYMDPTDDPRNIVGVFNQPRLVSIFETNDPSYPWYGFFCSRNRINQGNCSGIDESIQFAAGGASESQERRDARYERTVNFLRAADVTLLTDEKLRAAGLENSDQMSQAEINKLAGSLDQPDKDTPGFIPTKLPPINIPHQGFDDFFWMLGLLALATLLVVTKD